MLENLKHDMGQKSGRARYIWNAARLVWKSAPGWTCASLALICIQGILPLVSLYLMKLVVDAVASGAASPDRAAAFSSAALLITVLGVTTLITSLCSSLTSLVSEAQSLHVTLAMQDLIHTRSVEADLAYYENAEYYNSMHRAQQEAPYRPTSIVNGLARTGQSLLSLVALAGLLMSLHPGIAPVLLAAVVPGVWVRIRYAGQLYTWQRRRTSLERQAGYFHWLLTSEAAAKEIRLFELGRLFIKRFLDLTGLLQQERLGLAGRRAFAELATQAAATLAVFVAYAFIAWKTVQGEITVGDLVMYFQAFQRCQSSLRELLGSIARLYEDSLFLTNLEEFLAIQPQVTAPPRPTPVPRPMRTGIVFDRVSFHYPGSARSVLEDISLSIRPGEHIALVGENGAGKTTIAKLICRLYDPAAGAIRLDGIDLRCVDPAALRREISVVFQDYVRFHLTARENISLGDVSRQADQVAIAAAAHAAGADEVIARLPMGYDTPLGKWFEKGEELSMGEWQKIALARAFLRPSQIIVLDEPSSALDAAAEYALFQKFRELARDRSAVIISHRFSTVRMADCIYVLEGGCIAERGSHGDLIRRGGIYARLFELQAGNYR